MSKEEDLQRFKELDEHFDYLDELEFRLYWRYKTFPWTDEGCGVRVRTFFAWFPVCSDTETRWLRKVTVRELWHLPGWDGDYGYWAVSEFID